MSKMRSNVSSIFVSHQKMPLAPAASHFVRGPSLAFELHTQCMASSGTCTKRLAIRMARVRNPLRIGMRRPAQTMTIALGLLRWRLVFGPGEMGNPRWLPGTSLGQSRHDTLIHS